MPVSVACGEKKKKLICPLFSGSLIVPIAAIISTPFPAFNILRKESPGSCRGELAVSTSIG